MPDHQHDRRQYGFNRPQERPTSRHKETTSPRTQKQVVRQPKQTRPQGGRTWGAVLLAVATFLWRLLVATVSLLWKGIGVLWTHRPRLSSSNRERLRDGILRYGVIGIVVCTVLGIGWIAWISRDLPDPNRLTDRNIAQSTKIYDKTGEHLLYEIFADEKRTLITLDELPEDLIHGVVATEDTKFYEHIGIRPLSIIRAVATGLLPGRRIEGTSTLTQQLVKNAILTNERRISRKIKEVVLSLRLEQKYSKDQILQIYFNEIPYGSTNYGIESAAQSYFGKNARDLTLAESATLAGLPKAPTTYLNNPDALQTRRNFVLRRMFEEGYISEEEKNAAQAEPLELQQKVGNIDAPHFVLHVKELLVEEFGEQVVETGGLKVITTLDWDIQQIVEEAFEETADPLLAEAGANNMALVAMDPRTGNVVALKGSRDYFDDDIHGQFNVATLGNRQPGSSFKPIIYTAAFEKGYTPETVLWDVKTNFAVAGSRPYQPLNYNLQELGPVSIRQALQGSLNIPAVKALYLVGEKKGVEFAERLGYTTLSDGDFGLSLVLGGGEVNLLEHTAAYATFANQGVHQEPHFLLRVEDASGDVMKEWKTEKGKKVLEPEIAATISNVLSDDAARAYAFGAGGVLTLPGRPVAAKTGTTNSYVDGWTMGYTPSLVVGVWAGNTDNTAMKAGYGGGRVAGPVWKQVMQRALEDTPVESFPPPPPNDADKAILRGSAGGAVTVPINRLTGRRATSSTPDQLVVERTYTLPHSILHYVDKDNPRGPSPEDPTVDPQYTIWEAAIQDWVTRQREEKPDWDIIFGEPPEEVDDEYSLELIPTLEVVLPAASSTLTSRQIDTDIRVSAPRGVALVRYQIDGKNIAVVRDHPFNLNYYAQGLVPGFHILTIIVEDDIGNRRIEEVPFVLDAAEEEPNVRWNEDTASYSVQQLPLSLFLIPYRPQELSSVTIYASAPGRGERIVDTITDTTDLFNGQLIAEVTDLERGTWRLEAEVTRTDGSVERTDTLFLELN